MLPRSIGISPDPQCPICTASHPCRGDLSSYSENLLWSLAPRRRFPCEGTSRRGRFCPPHCLPRGLSCTWAPVNPLSIDSQQKQQEHSDPFLLRVSFTIATSISPLIMQRFHNLQPRTTLHNSPPLDPSQPLGSFLVIDPYPLAYPHPQKHQKGERKNKPKPLQPTPKNVQFAKLESLLPQQAHNKVDQKVREVQAIESKVQIEKKMGLGSKKKKNLMKQFILQTLLKAKAEGKCLVIHKGTAQPQIHALSPANLSKKSQQVVTKKESSARLQLPKALMQGNRQRMKPQASSLIFPSIRSSKRMLRVARELAEKREKREKQKEEVKQPKGFAISQVELIMEKIEIEEENQIEEEKEIEEEIFVGSVSD